MGSVVVVTREARVEGCVTRVGVVAGSVVKVGLAGSVVKEGAVESTVKEAGSVTNEG